MDYSRRGIRKQQQRIRAKMPKLGKMCALAVLKAVIVAVIAIGITGACVGIGMFNGILASAPDISSLDVTPSGYATIVYNNAGSQITKLVSTNSNRSYVGMDTIPEDLAHAFVAIEDERFYEHNGIDIKGIARAAVVSAQNHFNFSQGASTITQQLLKNNVFDDWVTENNIVNKFKRKFQEQYLALELEKRMSKDDILELYMNSINLGQNTLGVQAASMRYFNKPVNELNLSECAVIASITQNPSKYNPISHPEENAKRRKRVLDKMLEYGYIDERAYDEAIDDAVYSRIKRVDESIDKESVNSYFVDALIDQVIADLVEQRGMNETQAYNLVYSGGLQIYSTQDPQIQGICDEIYQNDENFPSNVKWLLNYELTVKDASGEFKNYSTEMFKSYFKQFNSHFNLIYTSQDAAYEAIEQYKAEVVLPGEEVYAENVTLTPQPQVSITVEDQHTGYIVAMVGGRGTKSASRTLNRASSTKRQPGSTFKVVSTYAPALDSAGKTLASVQYDGAYNYVNGTPVRNWYSGYKEKNCTYRYGIEQSLNIVAVKTLTEITPQLGYDYLKNFGFTTIVDRRDVLNKTTGKVEIFSDIQQSMALGGLTDGVTNMELNAAYATIANGGVYIEPALYSKILDHDGNILLERNDYNSRRVLKETTAWLLTDAMVDVVTKGTGTSVNFGNMSIAGKTGTTSDYKDVWFAGYTPYYTATCWTGYDNNVVLDKGNGERNLSKTLWKAVMSAIHEGKEDPGFPQPDGIITASVCSESGLAAIPGICPTHTEYFAEGTVPKDRCTVHFAGNVCALTGLPAADGCPYAVPGVVTMPYSPDGTGTAGKRCPHTIDYYINHPEAQAADAAAMAQQQQQAQMAAEAAAAQAAAQAQAQQQAEAEAAAAAAAAQSQAEQPQQ